MRKVQRFFALAAMVGGLFLLAAMPAGAQPKVTVTPDASLADGARVTVAWVGFSAGEPLTILECAGDPTGTHKCDEGRAKSGVDNASGNGSTDFVVHAGMAGGGVCDATTVCWVVVNQKASSAADDNGFARISVADGTGATNVLGATTGRTEPLPHTGTDASVVSLVFGAALLLVGFAMATFPSRPGMTTASCGSAQ